MSKFACRVALIVSAAVALSLATAPAQAATITGQNGYTATLYGNPFTGSTNEVGTTESGKSVVVENSIDHVVSQLDERGEYGNGSARMRSDNGATTGYMKFKAVAPFKAGTVIGHQAVLSFFPAGMDYNAKLDGNTVQVGSSPVNTGPIFVSTVPTAPTVQTLQLDMHMTTAGGTATYAVMNEMLILPDPLMEVASTATTPDGVAFVGEQVTGLVDHSGSTGWYSASASGSATLTFSGTHTIRALVLSSYESAPVSFDIYNDANVMVASGSLIGNGFVGDFVGVHFLTPVTTSSLRFVLTGGSTTGFTEIIPFEAVPEPTSLSLVMAGGLMLLNRRRAR